MALKAGYWGIKKLLSPLKLFKPGELGIDQDALVEDLDPVLSTFMTWTANGVLGAHQLLSTSLARIKELNTTGTWNNNVLTRSDGVVFTVNSDLSITVSNSTAGSGEVDFILQKYKNANSQTLLVDNSIYGNSVRISGTPKATSSKAFLVFFRAENASVNAYDLGDGVVCTPVVVESQQQYIAIRIKRDNTFSDITIKPLVTLAEDTDPTYQPYAMTNRELTDRLVKDAIHQTVTEKGLGFNFMRKDNVVLVEFVGEATEAIANDAKIIDIPSDYTMAIHEHAFTLYKNNISGGAIGIITIKADGIYANTAIAVGDKPRGSFTFAYAAGPGFTRSLPEATREASPEEVTPEDESATRSAKKSTKKTASADNNE